MSEFMTPADELNNLINSLSFLPLPLFLFISQLIGRTTSLTANRITLWRLRRETKTLTSEQKVKKNNINAANMFISSIQTSTMY